MSGISIIRYFLADDSLITASVPASRIKGGLMPINTQLPSISIRQISGQEHNVLNRGSNQLVTERIQITILATSYSQQKSIISLMRNALANSVRGEVNGFDVDSIEYESDGPDLYTDNPAIYEQSIDYLVRFIR